MKNKKFKFKRIICAVLCVLFCVQPLILVTAEQSRERTYDFKFDEKYGDYYAIANLEDYFIETMGEIDPQIDELLDLYVEYSLYDLTRDQAITSMLRKYLIDNYETLPKMGNALLTAFDSFGGYYANTTTKRIFSSAYLGYGILLDGKKTLDGFKYGVIISQVFEYTPAYEAELKAGDEIIKIDNINVEGFGITAVSNLLSAIDSNKKIDFTVKRNGKEVTVSMRKDVVYAPSLTYELDEKSKTAVLTIADFIDYYLPDDVYFLCEYLSENGYENLIIDLRGNPGGDVITMLETLNLLIPEKGIPLCSFVYKDGSKDTLHSTGDSYKFEKITMLTDGQSASASEIFALSLSEITGAVIIGEKTFGKGVGQFYFDLKSGDTAAVTSFGILSSKGNDYNKKGVEPDIKISREYVNVEIDSKEFAQLNFVNCAEIKKDAENNAVLALNQRLARIGYISPEDITGKCTVKTITAVEIFQKFYNLPVGISKIDYKFIERLNYYVSRAPGRYEQIDVQLECAKIYIDEDIAAAEDYARELSENEKDDEE